MIHFANKYLVIIKEKQKDKPQDKMQNNNKINHYQVK